MKIIPIYEAHGKLPCQTSPAPRSLGAHIVKERSSLQRKEDLMCNAHKILFSLERRRRDLNPRAAINDLHPFQGCPFGQLGYFSKLLESIITMNFFIGYNPDSKNDYIRASTKLQALISSFFSGEDGIRTHAPRRTNGFQDRLVMTASIPLQAHCFQRIT